MLLGIWWSLCDLAAGAGAVAGLEGEVGELIADDGVLSRLDAVSSFFLPNPQKRRFPDLESASEDCERLWSALGSV